jgi:uncharacterized protein
MIVGTVASIRRFPVKSLAGESLTSVEVTETGIPGDRARTLLVRSEHARTGKSYRGKEDERLHLTHEPADAIELAAERSVELELREGEHFFDDAPISILVDRWLEKLSAHVGYPVEPDRFRSNFFVRAAPGFQDEEAALVGTGLLLGTVGLRVRAPIGRCVTPTYSLQGGPSDPEILRFVAQRRDNRMGIYCDVTVSGVVRVGDTLARIES